MTAPGVRSGLRVLVVDDDVDTVETTSLLFLMSGYDARTAFSGSEAIERARAFKPHLILLDIGMPKMNGYAVARELRRSASVLRMPSMGPARESMVGCTRLLPRTSIGCVGNTPCSVCHGRTRLALTLCRVRHHRTLNLFVHRRSAIAGINDARCARFL